MKICLSLNLRRIFFVLVIAFFCFNAYAQRDEKNEIVRVIKDEYQAYLDKDEARWASHWLQTANTRRIFASSSNYSVILSWDSIAHVFKPWFSSPEKSQTKIEKKDFSIRLDGDIAIVDLLETLVLDGRDAIVQNQTIILQKQDGEWKMTDMLSFLSPRDVMKDESIEANLNNQGYYLLERKKVSEAIKVFELNTQLFPGSWNTWDSLAEGYMTAGDNDKAVECYEKSLAMNPANGNAKKYLAALRASKK